jgi:DNA polymerase-4
LDVRKVPGVGKVTERNLHAIGIRKVGDLARLDGDFLEQRFGKWGMALAGKSRGLDAGGWFDTEIGEDEGPKSISHEHTFTEDTADVMLIEATLARLCEMVGRRLREQRLNARTIQLKLRYADFSTITRAHSVPRATQIDTELFEEIRNLFRANWQAGRTVRLLGVHASGWAADDEQMSLMGEERHEKWKQTMAAADRLRDRFGESAVSLAASMRGKFRERTHENPAGLPGKKGGKAPAVPNSRPENRRP